MDRQGELVRTAKTEGRETVRVRCTFWNQELGELLRGRGCFLFSVASPMPNTVPGTWEELYKYLNKCCLTCYLEEPERTLVTGKKRTEIFLLLGWVPPSRVANAVALGPVPF
ncbi:hypothetical protein H1C71_012405 [Ictidomys tridecemlineatus]|nr:hypothetical protein H1C71_012405 [Ictidomys tridecemlineatus]